MSFQLRERYLKEEDLSDTKATYRAIRKALATLDDPFTRFLEPVQYSALRRGNAGSLTGVGLEVGFDTKDAASNSLVVRSPCRPPAGQQPLAAALSASLAVCPGASSCPFVTRV
jgi:C-terminal processing protease CtpA/Prc